MPWITDAKASLLAKYRGLLNKPRENAFQALSHINLGGTKLCLDVGGAQGQSVAAIRSHFKNHNIVSFEPNPFFSARIKKRFRHDSGVGVETIALGDEDGHFPLYIPIYKYCAFPELGTFEVVEAGNWLSERIYGYSDEQLTIAQVQCKCVRLDALQMKPDLIKIDCRCNASKVILGGAKTIEQMSPAILMEAAVLSGECQTFMENCKYSPFTWSDGAIRQARVGHPCDLLLTARHLSGRPS